MLTEKQKSLLVINGIFLLVASVLVGWAYFFMLLKGVVIFPVVEYIEVEVPGDRRAWNMAHLEAIMNGLILIAIAFISPYVKLGPKQCSILVWSSLIFAWLFTLPAIANAIFETRGLAFDGGPFEGGLANNLIYLSGWPSLVSVHIAFALLVIGGWKHYRSVA